MFILISSITSLDDDFREAMEYLYTGKKEKFQLPYLQIYSVNEFIESFTVLQIKFCVIIWAHT